MPDEKPIAKRLEEIERSYIRRADANRAAIQKLARNTYRILAVLATCLLILGVWSLTQKFSSDVTARQARHTANTANEASQRIGAVATEAKNAAMVAEAAASEALRLGDAIQRNRLAICREQDARNHAARKVLARLAEHSLGRHPTPGQRARLRRGVAGFGRLIDAELPVRNCKIELRP